MRNPCLVAALDELAKAGVHHPEIAPGGKHLQVKWIRQARYACLPA